QWTMLLQGQRQCRNDLYNPKNHRLTGNFFMFDEADFSEATISPRFPAQPRWMSECEDFKQVTKLRVQVEAGDILWIPSGWFHTVRSSPKSVATSIFHHGMAAVPHGMLVSLLNPKHLRSIFQETPVMEEAQHVLTAKILSAYPDLDFQDEEDGQDEKVKDQEVAESFNRHLHRYSATSRQSLQELQGPQVVGRRLIEALARRPLVATLAEALERQWHNLVRESDLDSALLAWTKSAVNNLSASSKATTISGWLHEIFPGCLDAGCADAMREVALVSSDGWLRGCREQTKKAKMKIEL
ncbi:unnamed protein product, partial [Durusdinium trenchii]